MTNLKTAETGGLTRMITGDIKNQIDRMWDSLCRAASDRGNRADHAPSVHSPFEELYPPPWCCCRAACLSRTLASPPAELDEFMRAEAVRSGRGRRKFVLAGPCH